MCVQTPFELGCGRIDVLSWNCLVGVFYKEGRPGCPQGQVVVTWHGDDSPHLFLPNSQPCFGGSKECARVTSKAGENGQNSGAGRQLTLDKTVGSRVWRHTQGLGKRPTLDLGWGSHSKDGSWVAINWVTGSYSSFSFSFFFAAENERSCQLVALQRKTTRDTSETSTTMEVTNHYMHGRDLPVNTWSLHPETTQTTSQQHNSKYSRPSPRADLQNLWNGTRFGCGQPIASESQEMPIATGER